MINMVQNAKDQAAALAMAAYQAAVADGTLPQAEVKTAPVEIPKDTANGDFTTTFALAASKALRQPPRNIAQALLDHMDLAGSYFASAEIAGPGFLNFRLNDSWYAAVCEAVESEGAGYGTADHLKGQKIMVEFVSANPTGPMHMGNARGGVLGDTLASVLAACGADVTREFYVNDAGHQIDKFAHSIEARYLQIIRGEDAVPFPEDGYQGEDIKDLARAYYEKNGDKLLDVPEAERQEALAQFGLSINLPKMKTDLERYKIHYDNWFYESSLHESGYVKETVDLLAERGWTYEKDGALWLRTADILRDHYRRQGKKEADIEKLDLKDDVLRRANGFYTYFAADIAYHRNKFAVRGFDKVINIWGADHHGHVARLKGALDALGLNGSERLDIVLMQLVKQGHLPVRPAGRGQRGRRPVVLQCQAGYPDGVRSGPGGPGGQRKPHLLRGIRPRPDLLTAAGSGGGGHLRAQTGGRGHVPALRRGGTGPAEADRPVLRGDQAGGPGLRPQPHQPLSPGAGGRLPPVLHRLPHQGRGAGGPGRPAEAGG